MTIRIVSQEQVRFDIDVESYNRITRDVSNTVAREVSMNGSKCRTDDLS